MFAILPARPRIPAPDGMSWPHVVIVGGGFAGANAAMALKDARVRVTLIDRRVFKTFQPLLYQVAAGGLNPGDVTMMLRGLSRKAANLRVRQGDVVGIDPQRRSLSIDQGGEGLQQVPYDYLLIANGLTTGYFGIEGAREHAMPMYSHDDATAIRERIFSELERTTRSDPDDALHISIAGGGATGVEIAGALADFRRDELAVMYPELDPRVLQIRVLQRGQDILKGFDEHLRRYATDELRQRGVELVLGNAVKEVGYDYVVLADDTILESDITIWAAGVAPHEHVADWGLPLSRRGMISVEDDLQVTGLPGVYAAGDIASLGEALPQLAQPAIQTGRHAARMILAEIEDRPRSAFRYQNLGEAATIGRRAAIVIPPVGPAITGTAGWFAWLGIHVMKLMGRRNRRAVSINLLSLYAGRSSHQPNPVTGDVDSALATDVFEAQAAQRKFGPGHRA